MTISSASGCRASLRQRERMVGSRRPGACATMSSTALGGGSSRIFSTALALLRFISSAASTMATRHLPIAGVMCMKAPSSRTSSTAISARMRPVSGLSVRRRWNRSGCERASTSDRPGASAGTSRLSGLAEQASLGLAAQQEAREAPGKRCLADAARSRQQPGMVQAAALMGGEHGLFRRLVAQQAVAAPRRRPVVRPFELLELARIRARLAPRHPLRLPIARSPRARWRRRSCRCPL